MSQQQRYSAVPGFGPNGTYTDNIMENGVTGNGNLAGNRRNSDFAQVSLLMSTKPKFGQSQSHISSYKDIPSPPHRSHSSFTSNTVGGATAVGAVNMPLMDQSTSRPFASDYARQNIPSEEYFPNTNGNNEKYTGFTNSSTRPNAGRKNKKWLIIGCILFGIAALIGIIVGVVVSQVKKNNDNSSSTDKSNSNNTSVLNDSNDPSDFQKNSNLHQSFWGFAYTPQDALLPWCGATQTNVTRDIQLLSQVTTRLRLYGANCNQSALVLQAIQDTKVNMTVWLGIYVDSNETAYDNQVTAVTDVLKTYGTDHVSGITVGNEYILNTAGTDSTTSSIYLSATKTITDKIQEVNTTIQGLGLSKTLPIGTSDAGSIMSKTLGEGIDYFMANVHPWFGSVSIDDAAEWTNTFFQEFDVTPAALASNNPAVYIAETGWPTQSMNASEANDGAASPGGDASIANLQTFLDTFVCQANNNGTGYFYFEAFDEPWKRQYGGVEPYWGLWDSDRNLKNITIPTCS
ncbi:uncharacterized protein I206_105049 [Kwoniella pini CBS 10737]|uniref:glucan endo-1,3-beta-D-glucosidase n=1 Tax=Kwoniella pini CBS 10737 TaxID=1296096 RepID=A0A1B9I8S9_9TREE|nr:glucan 1,3-beta-glucosidase [Kwoniella pini CBS 10737]OCF51873.1 glucan 1,3-beta-glucosidase [Kwoniella pini CBS 10737]